MAEPSPRTALKRHRERGAHDATTVHAILDEALVVHVGVTDDEGRPVVLPTIGARVDDVLYLHGARANALLRQAIGRPVCVTATLIDGLVLARSAFHHSMNYRSVVVFGEGRDVTDPAEAAVAADAVVEHVARGRSAECRPPSDAEMRKTLLVAVPIDEASAKVRTGPPVDDEGDLALPHWAGEVPLTITAGSPVPSPDLAAGTEVPASVNGWARGSS